MSSGVGILRRVANSEAILRDKGLGDTGERWHIDAKRSAVYTNSIIPLDDVVDGIRLKLGEVIFELLGRLVNEINMAAIREEKVAVVGKKVLLSKCIRLVCVSKRVLAIVVFMSLQIVCISHDSITKLEEFKIR